MGSFVLAVGLWLRFDPETVSLLNGDKAPDTFFIGEYNMHVSWCSPARMEARQQHTLTKNALKKKKLKSSTESWHSIDECE